MTSRFRRSPSRITGPVVLALLSTIACSRPATPEEGAVAQADRHPAPLRGEGIKPPDSAGAQPSPGQTTTADPGGPVPFHDRENVPAGTLLTVRLKNPILISNAEAKDSFEAIVVDPVIVQGSTLIPRGTTVAGHVESARLSQLNPDRGYVRLALASVQMGGVEIPVQTASLFARQSVLRDASPSAICLEKGHRLTFRFTEAVYIAPGQRAQVTH